MPDVINNDELNALAAEYVLGTLDYEERKGANSLIEVDHAFRGLVRIWERRFGELHLMVESVTPEPPVWERVKAKVMPEAPSPPVAPEAPAPSTDTPASAAADTTTGSPEIEAPPVAAVDLPPDTASSKAAEEAPPIAPVAEQPAD